MFKPRNEEKWPIIRVACGHSLPRLLRLPFRGSPERVSCRLTISAARTDVVLLIRRTVRPSGIPSAVVWDHGASVSTGFPAQDAGRGPRRSSKVRS